MGNIKWIKITTDIFDDEKMKLIDAMPERDTILVVWIKLLILAGKSNGDGYLLFSENIPYDEEMLSTMFNRPINSIRLAIGIFKKFKMVSIHKNPNSEEELFYITNWEKHQNIEGIEKIREQARIRFKRFYNKKKQISNVRPNVSLTQPNATDIDIDKDKDKDKDKEKNNALNIKTIMSGKPDDKVKNKKRKEKEIYTEKEIEAIKTVIAYFNEIVFKKYSYQTKETQKFLKPIIKNYSVEVIKSVIRMKSDEWYGGDFEKYLTPSTLFRTANFEKYYNSLPIEMRGENV